MRRPQLALGVCIVLGACGPSSATGPGGDGASIVLVDADPGHPPADAPDPPPTQCETDPASVLGTSCEFRANCCADQFCIAGRCSETPGPCATNDDCPIGYLCEDGVCVGCLTDEDCGPFALCVDGICDPTGCPDGTPDIVGTWHFRSTLDVSAATAGFVLDLGDAAAAACDWLDTYGPIVEEPEWAHDVVCLIGDITLLLHDMAVEHYVSIASTGPTSFWANDSWEWVIFDPDGRHIAVDPFQAECPITVESFAIEYSCGVLYLDRHEVEMAVNGLVQLALDVLACQALDHEWGCSWDVLVSRVCSSISDPLLRAQCTDLITDVVIPDPCFSPTTMTLAGTAWITGAGQMSGDWAGTLGGDDFDGTFWATRP